jgi:hypothetical protein
MGAAASSSRELPTVVARRPSDSLSLEELYKRIRTQAQFGSGNYELFIRLRMVFLSFRSQRMCLPNEIWMLLFSYMSQKRLEPIPHLSIYYDEEQHKMNAYQKKVKKISYAELKKRNLLNDGKDFMKFDGMELTDYEITFEWPQTAQPEAHRPLNNDEMRYFRVLCCVSVRKKSVEVKRHSKRRPPPSFIDLMYWIIVPNLYRSCIELRDSRPASIELTKIFGTLAIYDWHAENFLRFLFDEVLSHGDYCLDMV